MERYQPSAVVLQCGADSLSGDRLGCFNLTLHGHAKCVEFMKTFNVPMLLLGGGGYTIRNVARCWTYETAVALDAQEVVGDELPYNDYFEYYGPDFKLHITPSNMTNQNSQQYLDKIKVNLLENMRMLPCAPGVQMQDIPEDAFTHESDDEDKDDPEKRISQKQRDKKIACTEEFSDSEDEEVSNGKEQKQRRDINSHKPKKIRIGDKDSEAIGKKEIPVKEETAASEKTPAEAVVNGKPEVEKVE